MHRPYTVPINFAGMCVMLAFPLAFIFVIIAISSQMALIVSGTLTVMGVFVYHLLEFSKALNLCTFNTKVRTYPLTYRPTYPSIFQSTYMSIYRSTYLLTYLSIDRSTHVPVNLSIYLCIR